MGRRKAKWNSVKRKAESKQNKVTRNTILERLEYQMKNEPRWFAGGSVHISGNERTIPLTIN